MNVVEVLTKARDHLEDPKMWFQGRLAEDSRYPDSSPVCARGAINWAVGGHPYPNRWRPSGGLKEVNQLAELSLQANDVLSRALNGAVVWKWNDGDRTHNQILEGFDKGIKLAQELGL